MYTEQKFMSEFRKLLDEKITSLSATTVAYPLPHEEYLVNVGAIRALISTKEEFEHLLKTFFTG